MASILIAGSTGAIGRELVAQSVADDNITRIVALSRRSIDVKNTPKEELLKVFPSIKDVEKAAQKLTVQAVDWEKFSGKDPKVATGEELVKALKDDNESSNLLASLSGHTFVAMCMGTTKKDAGSAEKFKRCDIDYVTAFGKVVKELNSDADGGAAMKQYSQISSEGSNSKSWFLYMSSKGIADEMAINLEFPRTSIFRPGLLGRNDKARTVEKVFKCIVGAMPVENVASALLQDCLNPNRHVEVQAVAGSHPDAKKPTFIFTNAAINKMQNLPPAAATGKAEETKEEDTKEKDSSTEPKK